jgi:hypothetical protein
MSFDDSFFRILLFIERWLKKGFGDEKLKCSSMIKELVLAVVSSDTMEAKAREIASLIEDPDYVRRSRSSINVNVNVTAN